MALLVESSGTQTAVINTEHTLASPTTAKTRVLIVDLGNLAIGDIVILRIKTKVLTGGTTRTAYSVTFSHSQAEPITPSIPVPMFFGGSFTLQQTAGTARNFDWGVWTLD